MIKYIKIKNFSLIKDLEIEFSDKLNVIYGESGSGKSLLLTALAILAGGKSSPEMIREGEQKAILECEIDGIGTVQKIIGKSKSSQNIDGENVTISFLKEKLTGEIENFSQGEQEEVYSKEYQQSLINSFIPEYLRDVKEAYTVYMNLISDLNSFLEHINRMKEKREFYEYQLEEINKVDIQSPDEEKNIEELISLYSSKEDILSKTQYINLEIKQIKSLAGYIESNIKSLIEKYNLNLPPFNIDGIEEILNEADTAIYNQSLQYFNLEEYDLDQLNSKLYSIQRLKKKLDQPTLKHVFKMRIDLENNLNSIDGYELEIEQKKKVIEEKRQDLLYKCSVLHEKQLEIIDTVIPRLTVYLSYLGFTHVEISAQFNDLNSVSSKGVKDFEFIVSFNKGFEPKPMRKIVSGGEASRLALAMKMISNDKAILVLDEVDTGLSGKTLDSMASLLSNLQSQIICVTHSKEIVDRANKKIEIFKEEVNGKTETRVRES